MLYGRYDLRTRLLELNLPKINASVAKFGKIMRIHRTYIEVFFFYYVIIITSIRELILKF